MIISLNLSTQLSPDQLRARQMLSQSLSRLNSGAMASRAADTADTTAASPTVDSRVQTMNDVQNGIGDALSAAQTQNSYLGKISDALNRMNDLAQLAGDAAMSDADRAACQDQFSSLSAATAGLSAKDFNGVSLFSGNSAEVPLDINGGTLSTTGVDLGSAVYTNALQADLHTAPDARDAADKIGLALSQLSTDRAGIEADQSRLNSAADQLAVSRQNISAASSFIPGTHAAEKSTLFARQNILVQSATAMLAQANAMPQRALRLLP